MPHYHVDVSIEERGPRGGKLKTITKQFFIMDVPNPGEAVLEAERRFKTHFVTTVRRQHRR